MRKKSSASFLLQQRQRSTGPAGEQGEKGSEAGVWWGAQAPVLDMAAVFSVRGPDEELGKELPEQSGDEATPKSSRHHTPTSSQGGMPTTPIAPTSPTSPVLDKATRRARDDLERGVLEGNVRQVKKALACVACVDQRNVLGLTAMMLASATPHESTTVVLKMLLEHRAGLAVTDHQGWNVLHHACRGGQINVLRFLIDERSDPAVKTAHGRNCIMLTTLEGHDTLFHELVISKVFKQQIHDRDDLGCTPLHLACTQGHTHMAHALIDHKAKVGQKDLAGKRPIHVACQYGHLETVKLLMKRGAKVDDSCNKYRTPIMYACLNAYEGVAMWLVVKRNASMQVPDVDHDTPMKVAQDMGFTSLVAIASNKEKEMLAQVEHMEEVHAAANGHDVEDVKLMRQMRKQSGSASARK